MYLTIKKYFDHFIGLVGLFLFISPILLLSLLIFIIDRQNPFFYQTRTGYLLNKFNLYKLRTMKYNKVTKLGSIIRKYKLDELPQFMNILKGDLALIGPRPLLVEYNNHYSQSQLERFTVMPGLTGLAQIKVNDSSKWSSKFRFDLIYVKNLSFKLDVLILYLTIVYLCQIYFNKIKFLEDHKLFNK